MRTGAIPAQRLLELYFYGGFLCCVLIFTIGCIYLSSAAGTAAPMTTTQGSLFPTSFARLAGAVSVDPTPNTGAVAGTIGAVSGLSTLAGILAILCFMVLVPALYSLVEIISLYEIVQDSLRNTSAIIIIISLIVLYGCLASFVFTVHLISSTGLTIILILNLVVGLLMVPVQAFGFLGAERESERLLLTYKSLAQFTGPIALLIGTVTLASSSFIVASYVNDNCRALTQKLPADFLRSMPQGAGCQKYYGNALRLDAEGVHYLDPTCRGRMGDVVRQ